MSSFNYPLSNVQVELMKLFSTNLSDKEAIKADEVWNQRNFSDDDMEKWLNGQPEMPLVVIDTNVLLVSISSHSKISLAIPIPSKR